MRTQQYKWKKSCNDSGKCSLVFNDPPRAKIQKVQMQKRNVEKSGMIEQWQLCRHNIVQLVRSNTYCTTKIIQIRTNTDKNHMNININTKCRKCRNVKNEDIFADNTVHPIKRLPIYQSSICECFHEWIDEKVWKSPFVWYICTIANSQFKFYGLIRCRSAAQCFSHNGIAWLKCGIAWYRIALQGIVWYCMVQNCVA